MKKLLTTLLLFLAITNLFAEISVKSFRKLENDLDARVNAPIKDFNGDISAIIKVVTTQTGFTFDCGSIGIVKTVNKPAEIWVYVPFGAKRMTITHDRLGLLRDYMFTQPIEKATVYEMVLVSGRVETTVVEEIAKQWLVISPQPEKAMIYIDDVFVSKGEYQAQRVPGTYNYRVEAPLYHTEAGRLEITDGKKELKVILKPAFGYLKINTTPENGATIIIDGKELSNITPATTEALASGEHKVQVIKEMYQPTAQKVTVADGQTTDINFTMQPNFAELTLTAPNEGMLYINGQQKTTGSWNGRLNAGVYSLEARLDKHRTAKQDIELSAGDVKTVNLQPSPIYGSLDIITTPSGANITINGKEYGTTPSTIPKLLIGEYTVTLSKVGYASVSKSIMLTDGKETTIQEILTNGHAVTIESNPSGALLYIDDNKVGITPYKATLTLGNHNLRALLNGNVDEIKIDVSNSSESKYLLNLGRYINIDADVKGCKVFVDNRPVGTTPYKGIFSEGNHTVQIMHGEIKYEKIATINKIELESNVYFKIKASYHIDKMSGPANLFLSILVPGLGDWNVTKRQKNGVGKMLWSYGLILSGVGCKIFSDNEYKQYHLATDQTTMDSHYTNANYANYAFYGLAATGLAVWITDIFWVANKGFQNKKERDNKRVTLIYDPNNQMVGLNYKINF